MVLTRPPGHTHGQNTTAESYLRLSDGDRKLVDGIASILLDVARSRKTTLQNAATPSETLRAVEFILDGRGSELDSCFQPRDEEALRLALQEHLPALVAVMDPESKARAFPLIEKCTTPVAYEAAELAQVEDALAGRPSNPQLAAQVERAMSAIARAKPVFVQYIDDLSQKAMRQGTPGARSARHLLVEQDLLRNGAKRASATEYAVAG